MPSFDAKMFVGRGTELARLRSRLDRARDGTGGIAAIVGEAGVGKSWLASAFAEAARASGATVLRGGGLDSAWAPPFAAWSDVVRGPATELGGRKLARALGAGAAAIAQLVPELRGAGALADLAPHETKVRLFDAVAQLLLHVSRSGAPLVLLLDDLHLADGDSLALLRHLARFVGRSPWLVVVTYREGEAKALTELFTALRRDLDYERVPLRGFSLAEAEEALALGVGRSIPPALARVLFEETIGHPLTLQEAARQLTGEGRRLPGHDEDAPPPSLRELGISGSVRDLVTKRFAKLGAETQRFASVASTFASGADLALLGALAGLSEARAMTCADEARVSGLLMMGEDDRHTFTHAVVRRAVYDAINPDVRARMHRDVARAMEESPMRPWLSAEIAAQYHASLSLPGVEIGAVHALAAARESLDMAAHDRAVAFLRLARAMAANAPVDVRCGITCELARAEAYALAFDDARASAEAGLTAIEEAGGGAEDAVGFLAEIALAMKDGGAPASAWGPLVETGVTLSGKKKHLAWAKLSLLDERLEPIASGAVHVVRVLAAAPQVIRAAREKGDERDEAATLDHVTRTRAETDDLVGRSRSWENQDARLRALDVATRDLGTKLGDHAAARKVAEEMLDVAVRAGSLASQVEAHLRIGVSSAALGDLDGARLSRAHATEAGERLGTPRRSVASFELDAALGSFAGLDWRAVADASARVASDPAARRIPIGHVAAGVAALGYALAGYARESRSLVGHLAPVLARCDGAVPLWGVALDLAALAAWHLGASDHAAHYLALLKGAPDESGVAACSSRALGRARMSILLEDWTAAKDDLGRAHAEATARGLRPLAAIALQTEATALLRAGDVADHARARECLERALPDFERMNMTPWITHTRQLLGRTKTNGVSGHARRAPRQ